MAAKNKKELQKENNEIKKELADVKNHYSNLLEEFRRLEAKTVSNFKCNKCDKNLEDLEKVKNPQEDSYSARQIFNCDHCKNNFNEKWKLTAHLKTC